jgi:hypothetical protein
MKLDITKQTVWAASIPNQPGGMAKVLQPLADAGVDLEFVIARRQHQEDGGGVIYLTGLNGQKQTRAAKQAGFQKTQDLHGLRVTATNRPGLAAQLSSAVGEAGINLRGFSAAAIGSRCVMNFAFDAASDSTKARQAIQRAAGTESTGKKKKKTTAKTGSGTSRKKAKKKSARARPAGG